MTVPSWAMCVIQNYRHMYVDTYKKVSQLSDEQIWDICITVVEDSDSRQQDEDRVKEMHNRSQM